MTTGATAIWLTAAVVVSASSAPAPAQNPVPVGNDLEVNTYTTGWQRFPAVAVNTDGRFTITWQGDKEVCLGCLKETRGRSYDSDGSSFAAEFVISSVSNSFDSYELQSGHALAADGEGNFIVVWSEGYFYWLLPWEDVFAQRLYWWGENLGTEFTVNFSGTGDYELDGDPAVASSSAGFVVVWERDHYYSNPPTPEKILARRFSTDTTPLGPDLTVNTFTSGVMASPAVAANADGSFVVVWASRGSGLSGEDEWEIHGRRYNAAGSGLGAEFRVNAYTTGDQAAPAVATGQSGDFLVVWQSSTSTDDPLGTSIQARRFGSNGVAVGSDFLVNSHTTSYQGAPAVAVDQAGDFVVVWEHFTPPVPLLVEQPHPSNGAIPDFDGWSIQARLVSAGGVAQGAQFQVNSYILGSQRFPAISSSGGQTVVAWEFDPPAIVEPGAETDFGIRARRFETPLFGDGFESGDTSRWSNAVGLP